LLPGDFPDLVFSLLDSGLLTLFLAPVVWWMFVVPLQRLLELRTVLLRQIIASQEEERARIARDLHDSVGQFLTGVLVGLRAIEETAKVQTVRELAAKLREQGSLAHEELRRMVRGLKPYQLGELGLVASVQRDLEAIQQQTDVEIAFTKPSPEGRRWNTAVETAAYRVFQEASTNAIRHGKPGNLQVAIADVAGGMELVVGDDGAGFDVGSVWNTAGGGRPFGLLSMRERVALLGGGLDIRSSRGAGTIVRAFFPASTGVATDE
jgi:signal transduction histidine kinase